MNFRIERFNKKKNKTFIQKTLLLRFSIKQLISTNAHLGYEVKRWNPTMRPFLWGVRNNMHILNLQETSLVLRRVFGFANSIIKLRKSLLFSSENKHIDHVLKRLVISENQSISSNRWIGGIISNFKEIRKNIRILTTRYNTLIKYALLRNRRKKLKVSLEGLISLYQLPAMVFVMNGVKSKWAINEVTSKRIPCAAIVDSTTSSNIDYPIPGNVYGFATQVLYMKLFLTLIKNARMNEIITFVKVKKMSKFVNKIFNKHL